MVCVKVELLRQNRKAGATLSAMNKTTQDMRFKQAVIEYSLKHGVTSAAIRYKTSRQNMPDAVTGIGENVFRNCSALEKVKFSKNLTAIPGYAFASCSSLREIDLPQNVSRIYKGCFESYGIRKVTVHCAKMWSTGQCFGSAPEVHAYKDTRLGVFFIFHL